MTINKPNFNPKDISFQKINATKSGMAYDEGKEFYVEGNDVSVTAEQQVELFTCATMSKEKVGGLTKGGKEKYNAAKKLVTMLTIIGNFAPTLIAPTQLRAMYKMQSNTDISQKKLTEAVEGLLELGLVEKCCLRNEGMENPASVLYKLSSRGAELVMKYCKKELCLEKDRRYPCFTMEALPVAWKVQENFQLCQLVTEMFKNNFASSVFFDSKYDMETENPKILNFVNVVAPGRFDKKLYIFAPRSQPGWEDYLTAALTEFAQRFENANEIPKLLLSCESAEMLYKVHYLVEELNLQIDVVYTEDIAPINDFSTAFSWFNGEEIEIQLGKIK